MAGRTYKMFFNTEVDVGEVTEVKFWWNNHIVNVMNPRYGAEKVELQRGMDKKM